jgi:hypothetical protein
MLRFSKLDNSASVLNIIKRVYRGTTRLAQNQDFVLDKDKLDSPTSRLAVQHKCGNPGNSPNKQRERTQRLKRRKKELPKRSSAQAAL